MQKIKSDKYIYPPRPSTAIPPDQKEFFKELGWIAQYKYNGSRCMIKHLPGGEIQLWNRHGERFRTYTTPDWLKDQIRTALAILNFDAQGLHILDGELLDQKHTAIKDTIVIWDVLVENHEQLLGTTYAHRIARLRNSLSNQEKWLHNGTNLGIKVMENMFMPEDQNDWDTAWNTVLEINKPYGDKPLLEGLMLKDPNGTLQMGMREENNGDWQTRCRVKTGRHNF